MFSPSVSARSFSRGHARRRCIGRGDDAVVNPHRAEIVQFELLELILLLKLGKQFSSRRAIRGNIISVNSTLPSLLSERLEALTSIIASHKRTNFRLDRTVTGPGSGAWASGLGVCAVFASESARRRGVRAGALMFVVSSLLQSLKTPMAWLCLCLVVQAGFSLQNCSRAAEE